MTIREIADGLDKTPRQGAAVDDPEGSRFVLLSDTFLRRITRDLRLASGERLDAEYTSGDAVEPR